MKLTLLRIVMTNLDLVVGLDKVDIQSVVAVPRHTKRETAHLLSGPMGVMRAHPVVLTEITRGTAPGPDGHISWFRYLVNPLPDGYIPVSFEFRPDLFGRQHDIAVIL